MRDYERRELRSAGYEFVPTGRAPHYSLTMPEATEAAAVELLALFGPTLVNDFTRRRR